MKNLCSVWLVPQENDEEYLRKIINSLAQEYHSPSFIPHLSLFAETLSPYELMKSVVDETFENEPSLELKVVRINQSDNFWKTVFIEFELSQKLKSLFEKINSKTEERDVSSFKPHVSLVYKTLDESERIKIVDKVNVKDKFTFNRILFNLPKIGDGDFYDIKNWRISYEKNLT